MFARPIVALHTEKILNFLVEYFLYSKSLFLSCSRYDRISISIIIKKKYFMHEKVKPVFRITEEDILDISKKTLSDKLKILNSGVTEA